MQIALVIMTLSTLTSFVVGYALKNIVVAAAMQAAGYVLMVLASHPWLTVGVRRSLANVQCTSCQVAEEHDSSQTASDVDTVLTKAAGVVGVI